MNNDFCCINRKKTLLYNNTVFIQIYKECNKSSLKKHHYTERMNGVNNGQKQEGKM